MLIDPATADPRLVGRTILGLIVPRPIGFISTRAPDGSDNLAPYSFFQGISGKPPYVMFCGSQRRDRTDKDSVAYAKASGEFVVNLCDVAMGEGIVQTSWDYPPGEDEFAYSGFTKAACDKVAVSRVAEAPAALECTVHSIHDPPGTGMSMVVGRVERIWVRDDIIKDGMIDHVAMDPLGRLGGSAYITCRDIIEFPRPTGP